MPLANSTIMPIVQMTDSTKPIIDVIIPAVAIVLLYKHADNSKSHQISKKRENNTANTKHQ